MYCIVFDVNDLTKLKEENGDTNEIGNILTHYGFENLVGNCYFLKENNLSILYKTIKAISNVSWFKQYVNKIFVFNVSDFSDFTKIIQK